MRRSLIAIIMAAGVLGSATAWADGGADYKVKCQVCHGANASGETPAGKKLGAKDLRLPEAQKKTDAQLVAIVRDGKNKMPAFKGKLTEEQMKDLVSVIRGMK
ncbi:MAG TPA: cytochrome c [Terriglobales bacterium]|nr:cytochrome c [Terriglobales bacterium]